MKCQNFGCMIQSYPSLSMQKLRVVGFSLDQVVLCYEKGLWQESAMNFPTSYDISG